MTPVRDATAPADAGDAPAPDAIADAELPRDGAVETHSATVYFTDGRAYKRKKPVRFAFLDFSTREARERACRREVELNRRLAPDVYLGVADVLDGGGEVIDHAVVMRRMPPERRLAEVVARGAADACVDAVARVVAAFHERARVSREIASAGSLASVARSWEDNLAEMRPYVGCVLPPETFGDVEALARRYLAGRAALFEARVAAGKIRDGHGDLLADDIFCLDDGPRILDCLDFDDRLRFGDVLADVAFLVMDLERLGRPDAAARFLARYREYSGDTAPGSLAHHYVAHRAIVRSKVACLRAEQGVLDAPGEAVRLLALARDRLSRARVRIALVGGLPGTGKSTLAAGMGEALGWAVVRSDDVRKDLAGIGHGSRAGAAFEHGIYRPEATEATYAALSSRARLLVERGESVILDASWTSNRARETIRRLAAETATDVVEILCVAPIEVAAVRLRRRRNDPSDATPEIAAAMAARADPWPGAFRVDTTIPRRASLGVALRAVDRAAAPEEPEVAR